MAILGARPYGLHQTSADCRDVQRCVLSLMVFTVGPFWTPGRDLRIRTPDRQVSLNRCGAPGAASHYVSRVGRPMGPRSARRPRKTGSWSRGCGRAATSRQWRGPLVGWELVQLIGGLDGLTERKIARQDDVFSLERNDERALHGPGTYPRNCGELCYEIVVRQAAQGDLVARPSDSRSARSRSVLIFRHDSPASRSHNGIYSQ